MKRHTTLLLALVVFIASLLTLGAVASATGDDWSCPAGTTSSYKIDNLGDVDTFTVPAPTDGFTIIGVSIKAGSDHYLYAPVTPGQILTVKADTGHGASHAHICEQRVATIPPTTTTEVPPSTSTSTLPPGTTSTSTTTSAPIASSTSTTLAPTTTAPASTSTSSPTSTSPDTTSTTITPTSSTSTTTTLTPATTTPAPSTTWPSPTTPRLTPDPELPATGNGWTFAMAAIGLSLLGAGLTLIARRP